MKATKEHISLETAKLLKDCVIESKYNFATDFVGNLIFAKKNVIKEMNDEASEECMMEYINFYPAFTWKEILWEYAEEFFGNKFVWTKEEGYETCEYKAIEVYPVDILELLQQKKYKEADEYFRKYCILIKNK